MRRFVLAAAIALPLSAAAAQVPLPAQPAPPAGTVVQPTGKAKKCMLNRDIQITKLSPADGYWVETINGWWRNTATGCPWFDNNRILRTLSINDSQCSGDVLEVVDRSSRTIVFGACKIGNWQKMKGPPPNSTSGPLGH
jgi:hypothetical protein